MGTTLSLVTATEQTAWRNLSGIDDKHARGYLEQTLTHLSTLDKAIGETGNTLYDLQFTRKTDTNEYRKLAERQELFLSLRGYLVSEVAKTLYDNGIH